MSILPERKNYWGLLLISTLTHSFCIYSDDRALDKQLFKKIYDTNGWQGTVSRSGPGSTIVKTTSLRTSLPILLKELNATVLVDAPCGDFYWMKAVNLSHLDQYIGIDIVPSMIASNAQQFANAKRQFACKDIVTDLLPKADVILCRDCLQHLTFESIFATIKNFKDSGSTYLLVSNHPEVTSNRDFGKNNLNHPLRTRLINLTLPPFNFPQPVTTIDEGNLGKVMSLWRLENLPDCE